MLINKLSVPIEANYKYARGVAVYGDIKNGANDHGEIIKSIAMTLMSYTEM